MSDGFDPKSASETIAKTRQRRWGLSVVYGLPVSSIFKEFVALVQSETEEKIPETYNWYSASKLHATLIRGKSAERLLPPISRHLIENIVCKINKCPSFALKLKGTRPEVGGHVRVMCECTNPFPYLTEMDFKDMERETGRGWRPTANTWVSIGYLKESCNKLTRSKVWQTTISTLSRFSSMMPSEVVVRAVKLLHFTNITLTPLETQHWISIPLNRVQMTIAKIDDLAINFRQSEGIL